jgi:hypothetical protein
MIAQEAGCVMKGWQEDEIKFSEAPNAAGHANNWWPIYWTEHCDRFWRMAKRCSQSAAALARVAL